jgi:cytochrome P450
MLTYNLDAFLSITIGKVNFQTRKTNKFQKVDPTKPTLRPEEFVYPVFWGGPRLCLGKDMARLEALNIAHVLLKHYRFEVLPHSEKMVNSLVQFYEEGLPVKVHARS